MAENEKAWFEKLSVEAILKKRQGHKSFVVDMTKKNSKCLFPVVTNRFVFGNVPANMEWAPEQVDVVKEMIDREAQKVVIAAVEAKKAGTFSRASFLDVPRLTPEQKATREADKKKKEAEREKKRAARAAEKKTAEAEKAKKKADREAKKRAREVSMAAKLKARRDAIDAKLKTKTS